MKTYLIAAAAALLVFGAPVQAQNHTDSAVIAEQQAAMAKLGMLHGEWRGPATATTPNGILKLTHTERVGPLLDGTALAVEGRGYDEAGQLVFHAFGIVSYDTATDGYTLTSWSGGRQGSFPLTVTGAGLEWSIPLPNGAAVVHSVTVADGRWSEVSNYVGAGMPPAQVARFDVVRIGDTGWPAAGFVTPGP